MKHEVSKKIRDTNTPKATQNEQVLKFRHEYLQHTNTQFTKTFNLTDQKLSRVLRFKYFRNSKSNKE